MKKYELYCQKYMSGLSETEIAAKYGVTRQNISDAVYGIKPPRYQRTIARGNTKSLMALMELMDITGLSFEELFGEGRA